MISTSDFVERPTDTRPGDVKIAIEKMAIEIVSFPIENGDFP